jgi:hypothetical protein
MHKAGSAQLELGGHSFQADHIDLPIILLDELSGSFWAALAAYLLDANFPVQKCYDGLRFPFSQMNYENFFHIFPNRIDLVVRFTR